MKITDNVYQVDGIKGVNCYLYVTEDGITAVDAGMPGSATAILDLVHSLGYTESDLKWIVITHADIDHLGSAAPLKSRTGAKIAVHEADAEIMAGRKPMKKMKGVMGFFVGLMIRFMAFEPAEADLLLHDGDSLSGLRVIHAPGHTEGSICLYEPGGVLFAGDILRGGEDGSLTIGPDSMTLDPTRERESLKKLAELEFEILLPGHGAPVTSGASAKVRTLIS